jgi:hypothetical protein
LDRIDEKYKLLIKPHQVVIWMATMSRLNEEAKRYITKKKEKQPILD